MDIVEMDSVDGVEFFCLIGLRSFIGESFLVFNSVPLIT